MKGSAEVGLVYGSSKKSEGIQGYCDSNYATDLDKQRSLIGYAFIVGGKLISWKSNLQHIVALSTTKAEYVALAKAVKKALRLKGITTKLEFKEHEVKVYRDSQSAIHLSKNNIYLKKQSTSMCVCTL